MSRTTGVDFGLAGFPLTFKLELLQHAGSLIAQAHVARTVLVSDPAIRRVPEALWEVLRLVVEPGGAAAYRPAPEERLAVVLSGGNTTAVNFGA